MAVAGKSREAQRRFPEFGCRAATTRRLAGVQVAASLVQVASLLEAGVQVDASLVAGVQGAASLEAAVRLDLLPAGCRVRRNFFPSGRNWAAMGMAVCDGDLFFFWN